ncbi:MAG: ABC transporter substrate-binding protein [Methylococcales bacterium]|nr:ABC transporter substrate-binding protein [Methylococcales bacterium]
MSNPHLTTRNIVNLMFALAITLLLILPSVNAAADTLNSAQLAIKTSSDKIKTRLKTGDFKHDFYKVADYIDQVIQPHVDFPRISALVLGKHWRQASHQDRERFIKEFRTLLVRTYARAFVQFDDWSLHFLPMQLNEQDSKILVRTEVLQPGKPGIDVDYRMIRKKNTWKAYDIVIEGVSLVTNYRSTFANQMLSIGSLSKLIDHLAEKNAAALTKTPS